MRVLKRSESVGPARDGSHQFFSVLYGAVVLLGLSACGGGGGGGTSAPANTPEKPAVVTPPGSVITLDTASADAFNFTAAARYSDLSVFESDTGGTVYSTWSPSGPAAVASAGAKVLFFGAGSDCAPGTHDGTVLADAASAALATAASFGIVPSAAHSWIPSGATVGCSNTVQDLTGRSTVALLADANAAANNALALRTYAGPGDSAAPAFLLPQSAAGQDGAGTNAHITNTTVMFRQPWPAATTRRPWMQTGETLIHSEQAVSAITMPGALVSGELAQSKQQLMATFVNGACWANRAAYGHPCQVQIILHTAIARTDSAAFPTTAKIWFDPAQGGTLVVNGLIPAAGGSMNEGSSGAPVYSSYGSATAHAAFARSSFDVGVTLAQLKNILRIGTGLSQGLPLGSVTDDVVASIWGASWADPAAWSLLNTNAAQEIYNDAAGRNASIDGQYYGLYVGPK